MTESSGSASERASELAALVDGLEGLVLGQRAFLERLVVALLCGGHVLIEGVPGLAKTRAVKALASALGLPFGRVQFTPDLLPADLTGTQVYHPGTSTFEVHPGPIVTSVLLADEINRAPAKVQSALLEAMQEGQVTVGGESFKLPESFWVLATQNPVEHEGTYPLPEAQLDRFFMKLVVGYPPRSAELAMLDIPGLGTSRDSHAGSLSTPTGAPLGEAGVFRCREAADAVHLDVKIKGYVLDIVRATRADGEFGQELGPLIELGASPRATLALARAAKAHALMLGREYVTPHDVKTLAPDVLRHRVVPSCQAEAEDVTADAIIERLLSLIPAP